MTKVPLTLISLKKHFKTLLNERDKRIEQHFDAMEKAIIKAEAAHEKRLEVISDFKGQLTEDQSKTFVPRTEFANLKEKVEKMENIKQGGNQTWFYLAAAGGLITGIISVVLHFIK